MSEEKKPRENWFKGLSGELKKIIWPDGRTLARETTAVVSVSVALGIIIAIVDFVVQYGIDILVNLG